ncbi:MAG: 16S rRNA processing protein RimM [Halobacteriovoraceae bacterium]|nr:16S rRNA processing protein RimM [Halobacteriovoraceae bacterium]MCB9093751.1 16S rRNA processing protein RimM [Halobacteriovoraceae bacterium]
MNYVFLGKINKPHGLRGEAFFVMQNPEDSQLSQGKKVFLKNAESSEYREFHVESLNQQNNRPLLKLLEINSRTELEALIPVEIYMNREDFEECDDGEFYLVDLIGFQFVDSETLKEVGALDHYYSNGIQDIAVLSTGVEIPMTENFIKNIDREKRKVEIIVPELI